MRLTNLDNNLYAYFFKFVLRSLQYHFMFLLLLFYQLHDLLKIITKVTITWNNGMSNMLDSNSLMNKLQNT